MRDPKSDVADSQLMLQLHTYGQLPASFRPTLDISILQAYWRERGRLVKEAADAIRLMQKALDLMNLHLHKAISDLSGVTGLRIVRAIISGVHTPAMLAELRDPGIKCSEEEWSMPSPVITEQSTYSRLNLPSRVQLAQQQIEQCDVAISEYTSDLPDGALPPAATAWDCSAKPSSKRRRPRGGNLPKRFDLSAEVSRLTGRDWSVVTGTGPDGRDDRYLGGGHGLDRMAHGAAFCFLALHLPQP